MIDRHPRKDLGINTMGDDPVRHDQWQEGRAGDLSAEQLLESVQRGRVWLNLRRVMDHHAEYAKLVNDLYGELENTCPGLDTYNRSANLLISSPDAIVYYHVDCPVNMLWHLRGTKRVWAYPLESGIVSDETIEGVLSIAVALNLPEHKSIHPGEIAPKYGELDDDFCIGLLRELEGCHFIHLDISNMIYNGKRSATFGITDLGFRFHKYILSKALEKTENAV